MYERSIVAVLRTRMKEPLGLMQVLVGPRQTGKSTALKQASTGLDIPLHSVSADFADADWLRVEWQQARNIVAAQGEAILIVDEVQKIEGWSNVVKELWDEDRRNDVNLKVFLSGSSSLLLSKGLDEALTGRGGMPNAATRSATRSTSSSSSAVTRVQPHLQRTKTGGVAS